MMLNMRRNLIFYQEKNFCLTPTEMSGKTELQTSVFTQEGKGALTKSLEKETIPIIIIGW